MADLGVLKDTFKSYVDTLKATSLSEPDKCKKECHCQSNKEAGNISGNIIHGKKEYLCQSDKEVINFDKLVGDDSKSFDALYFRDNRIQDIYCIEFKNQKPSCIDKDKLDGKFIEGMKFLEKCFKNNNLQIKNYSFHFYVVAKDIEDAWKYNRRRGKNSIEQRLESIKEKEGSNTRILQQTKIIFGCVGSLKADYEKIFETKCK